MHNPSSSSTAVSLSSRFSHRVTTTVDDSICLCKEVIQWRRPVLSSFYLLCTNTAFWASVFYLNNYQQLAVLLATSLVAFLSCVLSTALASDIVTTTKDSYRKWLGPTDGEDEIQRSAILKVVGTVAFALESFCLPMFSLTFSLFYQRPASIMLTTGSATASHYLLSGQQERACWTAYLTVLLMVLIPPWRYNGVTQQIAIVLGTHFDRVREWLRANIFKPISRFFLRCFAAVRYCVCGYWIRPLIDRITSLCRRIGLAVRRYFLDPLLRTFLYLKEQFVYWAFGYWIPPLVEYLLERKRRLLEWIDRRVVQPIVDIYSAIRRFFIYWLGGYWIPPLMAYCVRKKDQFVQAFYRNIVDPIILFFSDFKNNVKYILLGHWIPPFLAWFRRRVVDEIVRFVVKCYDVADYVLRGRWIPGFMEFLRRKAQDAREYALECVRRTKEYFRQLAIRSWRYAKTHWLIPFVEWVRLTRARIHRWFINRVLKPTWEGVKRQWARFKFYVKHHVLYPALRRTAYYLIIGIIFAWERAVVPAFNVLSAYFAIGKDYAWINWGEPGVDWLKKNLPEKSPLVDDSDTELQDFLPPSDDESDNEANKNDSDHMDDGESVPHPLEPGATGTAIQSGVIRLKQSVARFLSPDVGSSSEEEDEFSAGLKNFPSVENADSDEEEEKSMVPRKVSSTPSSSTAAATNKRSTSRKLPTSGRTTVQQQVQKPKDRPSSPPDPKPSPPAMVGLPRSRTDHEPDFEMIDHNDVDS